jgi:hypothetical protein
MSASTPFLRFEWPVPVNGFRWRPGISEEGRASANRQKQGLAATTPCQRLHLEPGEVRVTRPLQEEPSLFRKFANLEETPEATLLFANQHGSLLWWGAGPPFKLGLEGDGYYDWIREIRKIHTALDLWTAIDQKDIEILCNLIQIKDRKIVSLDERIVHLLYEPLEHENWIRYRNMEEIRKGPSGSLQIASEILGFLAHIEHSRMSVDFQITSNASEFDRFLEPPDLISALWFQFGELLTGGVRLVECPGCSTTQLIKTHVKSGPDRVHCSEACRSKAHRLREKARELRAKRVPINSIAQELGRNRTIVRNWLSNKGEKR